MVPEPADELSDLRPNFRSREGPCCVGWINIQLRGSVPPFKSRWLSCHTYRFALRIGLVSEAPRDDVHYRRLDERLLGILRDCAKGRQKDHGFEYVL